MIIKIALISALMISVAMGADDPIRAIPEVKAIVGEASNQGYKGMLMIAVGIRNRGTLKGVYGRNATHCNNEPEWVWEMANKAWKESEHNRIHSGTNWENIKAFGKPKWADSMTVVAEYKDHIFYKEEK